MSPTLMILPPIDSTEPIEADVLSLAKMCCWCDFYEGLGHRYKDCYTDCQCAGLALFNQVRRLENENENLKLRLEKMLNSTDEKG